MPRSRLCFYPLLLAAGCATVPVHAQPPTRTQAPAPARPAAPAPLMALPPGWRVEPGKDAFEARHPDGSTITVLTLESPNDSVASMLAMSEVMTVGGGACGNGPETPFALETPEWSGRGFQCNNRPSDDGKRSQTIVFVARKADRFYTVLYNVPRADWPANRPGYEAMLKTLHPGEGSK